MDHQSDRPDERAQEIVDFNQLHRLANEAQQRGLIIGHGHHQGEYELLKKGQVLTFTPQNALAYLQKLLSEQS